MGFEAGIDEGVSPDIDVAIVGAGISGIGMAAHLRMHCPERTFAVLEGRANLGGTWDLFRYPGIRSDSDMHTLGFDFEPWREEKAIADGASILDYLNRVVDDRGLRGHIRFGTRVVSADWNSASARWVLVLQGQDGQRRRLTARFLYLGSGYYDYDQAHDAAIAGADSFEGRVVHPQFWPEDLDYAGKRVIVIGSGATAVTVVPAMARTAAHVTMLQRTPTWYIIRPAIDRLANTLRRFLPERIAYAITRLRNVRMQRLLFQRARQAPGPVKAWLSHKVREALGDKYEAGAFTPPYGPWEQRLCLVPDADLFEAIRAGRASVVTDHIDRIDKTGVALRSGRHIDADVIVTATGLKLVSAGKIALSVDGVPVDLADHYWYKGCMFSNIPNLALVFGYLNASWTLRADLDADYVCRLLNHMRRTGVDSATPVLPADAALEEDNVFDFSSGYIERSRALLPKSACAMPWRLSQDYVADRAWMKASPVDDGIMRFDRSAAPIA